MKATVAFGAGAAGVLGIARARSGRHARARLDLRPQSTSSPASAAAALPPGPGSPSSSSSSSSSSSILASCSHGSAQAGSACRECEAASVNTAAPRLTKLQPRRNEVCLGQRSADLPAAVARLSAPGDAARSRLRVVVDFDYTLTKYWVRGERGYSCFRVIEECGLLPESYHTAARALQAKYYPLEVSTAIPHEEKYQYMVEWVEKANEALIASGFRREHVAVAVRKAQLELREGVAEFLRALEASGVPVLIFSAGIADILEEVLRQQGLLLGNMTVESNRMCFDEGGTLVGFEAEMGGREPFHVFNKRFRALHPPPEHPLRGGPWCDETSSVLLVGDSTGDVNMADGMDVRDVVKVGFLNHDVDERLEEYRAIYDLVVLDDGDFGHINTAVLPLTEETFP